MNPEEIAISQKLRKPTLYQPEYKIKAFFSIATSLRVKTFGGLWRTVKPLGLPDIPPSFVDEGGLPLKKAYGTSELVSLEYIGSEQGTQCFHDYVYRLQTFLKQHQPALDNAVLEYILMTWNCAISIVDSEADLGERCIHFDDMDDSSFSIFERFVQQFLSYGRKVDKVVFYTEGEALSREDFFTNVHYFAIDNQKVIIHFFDFDENFKLLNSVELDYKPFAKQLKQVYEQLLSCVNQVNWVTSTKR